MTDREPFAIVRRDPHNGSDYLAVGGLGGFYVHGNKIYLENDAFNINAAFNEGLDEELAKAIREGKP